MKKAANVVSKSNEDQTNRWSIRKDSPTDTELADLEGLIRVIAQGSGVEKGAQKRASDALMEAIHDFRKHYPYVRGGSKTRGSIAEQRKSLDLLSRTLLESLAALKSLPLDAKRAFGRRINSPIGKVNKFLGEWAMAASVEWSKAKEVGDRPIDDAPSLLAFDVAKVLKLVLQGRITLTSDRNTSGTARNGAAYCRLLRATLQACGAEPASDLVPTMRNGKKLFDDFRLDAE